MAFLNVVSHDIASPLRGCLLEDVTVSHGRLHRKNDPTQGEEYTAILARHGLDELTVDGENTRPQPQEMGIAPAGAFGAKFVEVRVDPDLGLIRSVQSNADPPTVLARRGAGSGYVFVGAPAREGCPRARFGSPAGGRGTCTRRPRDVRPTLVLAP